MVRKLSLIAVALAILLGVGVWLYPRFQHRLTVVNQSGQSVKLLTITVGGETTRFENIPPAGSASGPFTVRGDDHFRVQVSLQDGTEIRAEGGYVTNGSFGDRVRFTIRPGGRVEIDQGPGW